MLFSSLAFTTFLFGAFDFAQAAGHEAVVAWSADPVVQAIPPPPGWGPGGRYRPSPSYSAGPSKPSRWHRIGGYGGGRIRVGGVGSSVGVFFGGGGGLIVGPLSIGGAGYWLAGHSGNFSASDARRYRIDLGYGGLEIGGALVSRRVFDLTLRSLIGVGGACLRSGTPADDCIDHTGYVALDPEFIAHFYANDVLRLGLGVGYRFALTGAWYGPDSLGISGPFVGIGLDFGRF